ncbi:fibronectin type III domain-containing protein [Actinoplanes sp. NPDC051859]|uniref:fibronectin type III domain-containing protein n=1 Tax=Actinoplanes sp. NPDC051859 TaxID=3363909 RepID=UPI00379DE05F
MPPPLAALTAQAQTLTAAGDLAAAREVLAGILDPGTDPDLASPDVALAAGLLARILVALGDAHAAQTWSQFAHTAEHRLHGPDDERTIAAVATHAAVLHRVGNHGRAVQVYRGLVAALTTLDGPLSDRVLAAEADLATAEHAAGQCTAARTRLTGAWSRHREAHGDTSPAGIKMLARLGAMERECGREDTALSHLTLAQELCARHLPTGHSLTEQIARLTGKPASGQHRCGQVQRSTGPDSPAIFRPSPAANHPLPGADPAPSQPGVSDNPPSTAGQPSSLGAGAPVPAGPPSIGASATGLSQPTATTGSGPADRPSPTDGPAHTADQPWPGPDFHPAAHRPWLGADHHPAADGPLPDEDLTPVTAVPFTEPAPAEETAREGREPTGATPASAPTAATSTAPAGAAPRGTPLGGTGVVVGSETAPGVYPVGPPSAGPGLAPMPLSQVGSGASTGVYVPRQEDRSATFVSPAPELWPEPADRAGAPVVERWSPVPKDRLASRQPFLLATVLVAGVAAAAAIVAVTLPRGDRASTTPTAPVPSSAAERGSSSAPAEPPPVDALAPVAVALRDNRDSVSLTWRYPPGSEGPVLISGGREGQEQRAFQQLAAGTTEYVVYGLNEQNDYCFTVAVVYTVDKVAASSAVCTQRR